MKLSGYIKMDKDFKKGMEYYDTKNLGIAAVGMFLFCTFVLAGSFNIMDHIVVLNIYIICFLVASSLYIWPLVHVREKDGIISIFKKYRSIPINKRMFIRAKVILLVRFSIIFYLPIQVMHFIGLMRTNTPEMSIVGFWPLVATVVSICVQYLYMRFQARVE